MCMRHNQESPALKSAINQALSSSLPQLEHLELNCCKFDSSLNMNLVSRPWFHSLQSLRVFAGHRAKSMPNTYEALLGLSGCAQSLTSLHIMGPIENITVEQVQGFSSLVHLKELSIIGIRFAESLKGEVLEELGFKGKVSSFRKFFVGTGS